MPERGLQLKRGTPKHPKVYDLCERLHCDRPTAVGYLELLWHFTAEFCPQGDIGRFPVRRIEGALDWSGRGKVAGRLVQCLRDSGWIDESREHKLLIHDWEDHADESVRKRLQRSGLWFHSDTPKVTEHCLDTDGKVSARLADKICLPEPEPKPEPEPGPEPTPPYPPSGELSVPSLHEDMNGTVPTVRQILNVKSVTPEERDGQTSTDPSSAVRSALPARRRKAKRTTEEIKTALGPRLPWWDEFWKIYPCHDGMHEAIDAFERRVTDRELAVEIYQGAKRYAAQIGAKRLSDPLTPCKWAQGWINQERWLDEAVVPLEPSRTATIYQQGHYNNQGEWVAQ